MQRIWREHGLRKPRKKKYQRKQDLAHSKAQWALFQQSSADTKDLADIPHYGPQAQQFRLLVIQYPAREVRSGLWFWAFAEKRSAAASAVFASRIQQLLERCGISLRDLLWQTDNGGECKGDFPKALGDRQHVRLPPAAQHLSERRGNGSSPGGRRVLRPRRVPNAWRVPRQSAQLAAVLQPRTAQLAERKSQPLANHRAARSPLTPRILLASACLPGLLPQRLRGYDVPRLP